MGFMDDGAVRFVHQLKLSIVENLTLQKRDRICCTYQWIPACAGMESDTPHPEMLRVLRNLAMTVGEQGLIPMDIGMEHLGLTVIYSSSHSVI